MHSFSSITKPVIIVAGALLFLGLLFSTPVQSQEAVIEGTVTNAITGDPLPGANILLQGTTIGTATNIEGRYRLTVPAARVTGEEAVIEARYVGFRASRQTITLTAATHTVDFEMAHDVLGLEEVVVTGVVGATFRERLPFSVSQITRSELEQVPYVSAESAIRGKVTGARVVRTTGQPGTAARIQLRGATSIDTRGRSNEPLYVIDGVVSSASMIDLDAMDIESIEVVKGAAAASLYGARAAAGVINIQTARGQALGMDQTRVLIRNEFGMNDMYRQISRPMYHPYAVEDGNYIDPATGNVVDRQTGTRRLRDYRDPNLRGGPATSFMEHEYPGETFDHVGMFHDPGQFMTNTIQLQQRGARTNMLASFTNTREAGILIGLEGYDRQNARLNIDHNITPDFTVSASGYFSQSWRDMADDRPDGGGPGSPFFALMFYEPDIDLTQMDRDEDGNLVRHFPGEVPYVIQPDQQNLEENPLYELHNREFEQERRRLMGSFRVNFRPFEWLNLESQLSYDRSNRHSWTYYPKGYRTVDQPLFTRGILSVGDFRDESINAQFDATLTRDFGNLGTRTQLRYLSEFWDFIGQSNTGRDMAVFDTPNMNVTDPSQASLSNFTQRIRSEGFYLITGLDYDGRYIFDFLVRQDRSSLFGPDERDNTYYRFSGAYRMAQEQWWPIDPLNEFKLRYSIGTAGGRPSWGARFETWTITRGIPSFGNLGNRALKPEFSVEQEAGIEIGFLDRFLFEFVYAHTSTEDQVLLVPNPGYVGYNNRWDNAGTLESWTYEASLRGQLMQTREMSWSFSINWDKTNQQITELNVPPYRFGPVDFYWVQGADLWWIREGETFGRMYGNRFANSVDDLPAYIRNNHADQFQVNDDGYLVFVGQGNSWQDGIAEQLWGTSQLFTDPDGRVYNYTWGMPIKYVDDDGNDWVPIGNVVPDFNIGFSTNFRYKNFSIYTLLDAQIGGDIYNMTRQWPYRDNASPDMVQAGRPEENKKPLQYYNTLYNVAQPSSHFVEDGTFLKLRELAVRYTFDRSQLQPLFGGWLSRLTVGVIGRNLLTFTDYSGFDPEIGFTQEAVTFRYDSFQYPNYRTITGVIEIEF